MRRSVGAEGEEREEEREEREESGVKIEEREEREEERGEREEEREEREEEREEREEEREEREEEREERKVAAQYMRRGEGCEDSRAYNAWEVMWSVRGTQGEERCAHRGARGA